MSVQQNPVAVFLRYHGSIKGREDVEQYARFLRRESELTAEPPIDLERIFKHFGMPLPDRIPLPVQGLLMDQRHGLMLINADDPETRQRFSEAHELMEMLFSAVDAPTVKKPGRVAGFKEVVKERLCNVGAAELLMPRKTFKARVERSGVSFSAARALALKYCVSTTAALVRMAELMGDSYFVVVWRMKNKPSEIRDQVPDEQLCLFPDARPVGPAKKLRIEWSLGSGDLFVPQNKSVPDDTTIYTAWQKGAFTFGREQLDLGTLRGMFYCENQPFEQDEKRYVLSLLHFLDHRSADSRRLLNL